jgi:hypothetical protein
MCITLHCEKFAFKIEKVFKKITLQIFGRTGFAPSKVTTCFFE